MKGWSVVTLAEACTKIQDGAHRSPQILHSKPGPNRFPYLTSKNIKTGYLKLDTVQYCDANFHNDIYPRCNPEVGDILLTKDGANTGNAAINTLDEPFSLLSSVCLLKPDRTKLLARFLAYYIQSKEGFDQITGQMTGAAIKRIILKTIKSSQIPLPPLPEQKRIVAILDEAFTGITQAINNAEKNLANARELFESYLNSVFTQKGEGWVDKPLGVLTEKITKGSSPKWQGISYVEEPGTLFITSENVRTNKMNYQKTKFVEEIFNEKDSKSILKKGDVLTNIVGASIGRTAVFDRDDIANINQAVCLIRCDNDKLMNKYLAYLFNSPFFKKILHDNEINNARANLSLGFFRSLEIPVPNLIEQEILVTNIDAISSETQHLETIYQQKLTALAELKQSILQKAFTGELTADTVYQRVVNG